MFGGFKQLGIYILLGIALSSVLGVGVQSYRLQHYKNKTQALEARTASLERSRVELERMYTGTVSNLIESRKQAQSRIIKLEQALKSQEAREWAETAIPESIREVLGE